MTLCGARLPSLRILPRLRWQRLLNSITSDGTLISGSEVVWRVVRHVVPVRGLRARVRAGAAALKERQPKKGDLVLTTACEVDEILSRDSYTLARLYSLQVAYSPSPAEWTLVVINTEIANRFTLAPALVAADWTWVLPQLTLPALDEFTMGRPTGYGDSELRDVSHDPHLPQVPWRLLARVPSKSRQTHHNASPFPPPAPRTQHVPPPEGAHPVFAGVIANGTRAAEIYGRTTPAVVHRRRGRAPDAHPPALPCPSDLDVDAFTAFAAPFQPVLKLVQTHPGPGLGAFERLAFVDEIRLQRFQLVLLRIEKLGCLKTLVANLVWPTAEIAVGSTLTGDRESSNRKEVNLEVEIMIANMDWGEWASSGAFDVFLVASHVT
ncbi:hypothetical protein DFH09DRAFT_1095390 [Mycena vulgaris]|nr:hypothetical protein DFH09DRAFT_1095390 [Mycena vulgaris]